MIAYSIHGERKEFEAGSLRAIWSRDPTQRTTQTSIPRSRSSRAANTEPREGQPWLNGSGTQRIHSGVYRYPVWPRGYAHAGRLQGRPKG